MIKFYDYLLIILRPLIIFFGKSHLPFTRKKINGLHYYIYREKIKIGTVFLTKTRGEFSNLINPNQLKHGAIYVGEMYDDGIKYVLEATGYGVVLTDLVSFLCSKDELVIINPKFIRNFITLEYNTKTLAKKLIGMPYDYLFNSDGRAFYCFELVAQIFKATYPEINLKCKEIVKGKRIFNDETFLDNKFFEVAFDSRKNERNKK